MPELQAIAQRELDGLLALAEPESPEERIDPEYFGLLERQLALLRAFGAAAADGDLVGARDILAQAAPLGDEAAAIATGYGIVECAGGVEPEPSSPAPEPSGGPDPGTSPADEFAAAADAICLESRALVAGMTAPQTLDESVTVLRETIDISTAELAELRALEPPEELAASFDELLELRERQIALLEVLGQALAADDRDAAAETLLESARLDAESNMIEQQLGFEVCGMEPVQEVPNLPRPVEPVAPAEQGR